MLRFTPEEMEVVRQALPWLKHGECAWEQIGPCVYCKDHGERLYHGTFKRRDVNEHAAAATISELVED